jgi:hypothetical protein
MLQWQASASHGIEATPRVMLSDPLPSVERRRPRRRKGRAAAFAWQGPGR